MTVVRTISAPRRALLAAAGGFSIFGFCLSAGAPARAAAPHYSDIMPLSQVKAGMTGYGLTTFKGTTISRFEVTIIGILKDSVEVPGRNMILIRMKGGPITERGANLIHGMSGSPIYINGKIIGAFSMGEEFPKEPTGMVTPIEDMLEAWDPNIQQQPDYFEPAGKTTPAAPPSVTPTAPRAKTGMRRLPDTRERVVTLPHPIDIGGRHLTQVVLNARMDDPRHSNDHLAVMHRATSFMFAPGISERNRIWFQKELDKRGMTVTVLSGAAGGMDAKQNLPPLQPGSCFGTFLATGDVTFGGYGTVTYRRGNRILGFGHPMMTLGTLEGAITSAYVVDVFSGYQTSHLDPVAGPVVGTLRQDRNYSVSGEIGKLPRLIPFDITVNDETSHRSKTYHSNVMQHPDLTAPLLTMVAREAVSRLHFVPGDVMAHITTTVEAAEVGKVTRSNVVFDANDISSAATQDLNEITGVISGNPFYPLPVKGAHMTVDITNGHDTATVERIFLKQGRFEPGDTMDIGVVLKPYRRDQVTKTISVKIPADTPTGRYQLIVRGGTPNVLRFGGMILSTGSQDPQTPPVNVRQMVARLNERETNTDIVARLVFNTISPALEGEKLAQLPPNLSALMRSDRNSGVRLERDEVKTVSPANYVVSGAQQLLVTVVRKNTQESTGSGFGQPGASGIQNIPGITLPGGGGATGAAISDEAEQPGSIAAPEAALPERTQRWIEALRGDPPPKGKKDGNKKAAPAQPPTPVTPAPAQNKPDPTGPTTPAPAPVPAAPAAPDTSNDKPIGRQAQYWKQTARTDFAAGKFEGTSVAASGDLRLTASLHRLVPTSETYIWAVVSDGQGNVYAGTGTSGKILKTDAQGKTTLFAQLPVVSVQSLLIAHDGTLWAGSGVRGQLYHIQKDGSFALIRTLPEKYILALVQAKDGSLYIGPGGGGTLYRLSPAEQAGGDPKSAPTAFLKTSADHVMALAIDGLDNIYMGTGNDGIVYKVTPDAKSSVLYDAKENSITALAVEPDGTVYAGTGPKGILYRITPDGTATALYSGATSFYTGIQPVRDGSLYASTVSAVYHIYPGATDHDTVVQPLDNPKDVDFLSLAVLPDGSVTAGTGNIGEIYTSRPATSADAGPHGTFTSVVHDAKLTSHWGTLRWDSVQPAGSRILAETRSGNVSEPDATWSPWTFIRPNGSREGMITSAPARFIQYRLTLQADGGAQPPDVRDVSLSYMPRNQAPRVAFQMPGGGERWSKTQTVRWTGTDPDNDTLTYDLYYSADGGATWKPVPTTTKSASATPPAAGGSTEATPPGMISMDEFEKRLNQTPLSEPAKLAMLARYKERLTQMSLGAGGATAGTGAIRETSKNIDTTQLPDGTYQLKVTASDRTSNPVDYLTAEAVSEPFIIVNAVPKIAFGGAPVIGSDRTVTIEGGVSQSLIPITAVQYRIDGGDWIAATSKTGLFDSSRVGFVFATTPLKSGKHSVEVEAFNAAGAKSVEKRDVLVP